MENVKRFTETYNQFKKDIAKVPKANTTTELNELESRCVNELQLMIVEAEMCGRDLKNAVVQRDLELRNA